MFWKKTPEERHVCRYGKLMPDRALKSVFSWWPGMPKGDDQCKQGKGRFQTW